MVSFLDKWLSQSNMAFIILNFMHLVHTLEILAKISTKWLSFLSKFKDHTLIGIQLMHSFTINLRNWLTFSIILPITCSFSSNGYKLDQNNYLIIPIHSNHTISHSNYSLTLILYQTIHYISFSINSFFKHAFGTRKQLKVLKFKELKHKPN